ncbi:hypothetical protein C6Q35_23220 [Burkholderia multivorans]|nr:hypothetical protein C6Q35_23220 [Burkholderia multivorans]
MVATKPSIRSAVCCCSRAAGSTAGCRHYRRSLERERGHVQAAAPAADGAAGAIAAPGSGAR